VRLAGWVNGLRQHASVDSSAVRHCNNPKEWVTIRRRDPAGTSRLRPRYVTGRAWQRAAATRTRLALGSLDLSQEMLARRRCAAKC